MKRITILITDAQHEALHNGDKSTARQIRELIAVEHSLPIEKGDAALRTFSVPTGTFMVPEAVVVKVINDLEEGNRYEAYKKIRQSIYCDIRSARSILEEIERGIWQQGLKC